MKVPPKRKGNWGNSDGSVHVASALNESPSEKEGKCLYAGTFHLPKRFPQ